MLRRLLPTRRLTAAAAASAAGLSAALALGGSLRSEAHCRGTSNRPLGPRHRVSIVGGVLRNATWAKDPRCRDLPTLLRHLKQSGYDGTETSVGDLIMMFMNEKTPEEAIPIIREEYRRAGLELLGANYLVTDEGRRGDGTTSNTFPGQPKPGAQWGGSASPRGRGAGWDHDFQDPDFERKLRQTVRYDKEAGAQYITFQMFLRKRST